MIIMNGIVYGGEPEEILSILKVKVLTDYFKI